MIVRDKPTFWQLAFIIRGSVLRQILPQTFVIAALASWWQVRRAHSADYFNPVAAVAPAVIGSAFAIFAAFRNAAAYDRWWEARKNIGSVVIHARSLAREALATSLPATTFRTSRGAASRVRPRPETTCGTSRSATTRPPTCVRRNGRPHSKPARTHRIACSICSSADIAAALAADRLSPIMAQTLEDGSRDSPTRSPACDAPRRRCRSSAPCSCIERPYHLLFILPFGVVAASGYWTPLITAIVAYTFAFGLDAVGDELAMPFTESSYNTVPLNASRGRSRSTSSSHSARLMPRAALTPDRHVLT